MRYLPLAIDIVMEHKLSPYDMMALVPILLASGAIVTDWSDSAD